jgi:cytidylate kinase
MSAEKFVEDRGLVEAQPRKSERLRLINGYTAVVIFSPPAIGGTTLGKSLAASLEGARFYDGGKGIRDATGHKRSETKYMPRDPKIDKKIDLRQRRLLREATSDRPVVIVGKLAGLNALELMLKQQQVKVIRVLATCDRKIAAGRAVRRKLEDIDEDFFSLADDVRAGRISEGAFTAELIELNELREATTVRAMVDELQDRVKKDFAHWATIRPEIAGIDIYDPSAKVKIKGKDYQLYDFRVSTARGGSIKATSDLVKELKTIGAAEEIPDEPTQVGETVVFEESPSDQPQSN